jgi:hypothetical protein
LAAAEETFTMLPPEPPRAVDMRRTASRAQRELPTTLIRNMRRTRASRFMLSKAHIQMLAGLAFIGSGDFFLER